MKLMEMRALRVGVPGMSRHDVKRYYSIYHLPTLGQQYFMQDCGIRLAEGAQGSTVYKAL